MKSQHFSIIFWMMLLIGFASSISANTQLHTVKMKRCILGEINLEEHHNKQSSTYNDDIMRADCAEQRDMSVNHIGKQQITTDVFIGIAERSFILGNSLNAIGVLFFSQMLDMQPAYQMSENSWRIALDKAQFQSNQEAQQFAIQSITHAIEQALSQYGHIRIKVYPQFLTRNYYEINIDGEWLRTGFSVSNSYHDQNFLSLGSISINGHQTMAYLYGFDENLKNDTARLATAPNFNLFLMESQNKLNFSHLINKIQDSLPGGIHLYSSPFSPNIF